MQKSKIEWTKSTWNPFCGCRKCSPGCTNCYAERQAKRLKAMGLPQYQDVVDENGWTGKVCIDRWGKAADKSSPIFVGSMSDIFYEGFTDKDILGLYNYFKRCRPKHTFIVCTKRPERIIPTLYDSGYLFSRDRKLGKSTAALDNVWHLTSVENQEWADRRIPELIKLKNFGDWKIGISAEPLLGKIELNQNYNQGKFWGDMLDQVIVGGESGPGARPMNPDWVRSIRDQCQEAHVPFFFKQWGAWLPGEPDGTPEYKFQNGKIVDRNGFPDFEDPKIKKRWRVDAEGDCVWFRAGKKKAGWELDGKEYNELAWRT